jgi:hypothetical protein
MISALTVLSFFSFLCGTHAALPYTVEKHIQGWQFYNNFRYESFPDPTNGRVKWVLALFYEGL